LGISRITSETKYVFHPIPIIRQLFSQQVKTSVLHVVDFVPAHRFTAEIFYLSTSFSTTMS
jgi:hypothetical protein